MDQRALDDLLYQAWGECPVCKHGEARLFKQRIRSLADLPKVMNEARCKPCWVKK